VHTYTQRAKGCYQEWHKDMHMILSKDSTPAADALPDLISREHHASYAALIPASLWQLVC
jgi:hypothetical protein